MPPLHIWLGYEVLGGGGQVFDGGGGGLKETPLAFYIELTSCLEFAGKPIDDRRALPGTLIFIHGRTTLQEECRITLNLGQRGQ